MSNLRELYQQVIVDHGRRPRNYGKNTAANCTKEGFNPLCGDKLTLYLTVENDVITDAKFEGCGCAISMASASLMTESIMNKNTIDAKHLFKKFHVLVTTGKSEGDVGKLTALAGVNEFPARVKCATLAWHTMNAALEKNDGVVSTE